MLGKWIFVWEMHSEHKFGSTVFTRYTDRLPIVVPPTNHINNCWRENKLIEKTKLS